MIINKYEVVTHIVDVVQVLVLGLHSRSEPSEVFMVNHRNSVRKELFARTTM